MRSVFLALLQLFLIQLCSAHSPVLLWPAQKFQLPDGQSALEVMPLDDFQKLFEHQKVIVFHKKTFNLEEVSNPSEPLSYMATVDAIALQGVKSIHHLLGSLTSSDGLKIVHLEEGSLSEQQDTIKKTMEENPGYAAILVGSGSHRTRRALGDPTALCKIREATGNNDCMVYIESAKKADGTAITGCSVSKSDQELLITIGEYQLSVQKDTDGEGYSLGLKGAYSFDQENLWSPSGFSYSCSELNVISSDSKKLELTLTGVQILPEKGNTFEESYDCSTWFSSTLWMGTLISLFYIFLLFGAILYLLDVKVNDRFDDPKGKTITVNVAE